MSPSDRVRIHYRRLPDHEQIFDQRIVLDRGDVIVSVTEPLKDLGPLLEGNVVLLEPGARAIWFTFPGAWHDIGRFHLHDGTFTGYYANILTPVEIEVPVGGTRVWRTTDLFLDVWLPRVGRAALLDEDEMDSALERGYIDRETARAARAEADRLLALAEKGDWPPPIAREWTLERIQAEEAGSSRR